MTIHFPDYVASSAELVIVWRPKKYAKGVTVALDGIKAAGQRLVLCRLMFDIMRNLHSAYAPTTEPFGNRLEIFFVGLCIALGQMDGRPFSVAKIATYMRVPRATVTRRLGWLQSWGLIFISRAITTTCMRRR